MQRRWVFITLYSTPSLAQRSSGRHVAQSVGVGHRHSHDLQYCSSSARAIGTKCSERRWYTRASTCSREGSRRDSATSLQSHTKPSGETSQRFEEGIRAEKEKVGLLESVQAPVPSLSIPPESLNAAVWGSARLNQEWNQATAEEEGSCFPNHLETPGTLQFFSRTPLAAVSQSRSHIKPLCVAQLSATAQVVCFWTMRAVLSVERTASIPVLQQWPRGPTNELTAPGRPCWIHRAYDSSSSSGFDQYRPGKPNGMDPSHVEFL